MSESEFKTNQIFIRDTFDLIFDSDHSNENDILISILFEMLEDKGYRFPHEINRHFAKRCHKLFITENLKYFDYYKIFDFLSCPKEKEEVILRFRKRLKSEENPEKCEDLLVLNTDFNPYKTKQSKLAITFLQKAFNQDDLLTQKYKKIIERCFAPYFPGSLLTEVWKIKFEKHN